MFYENKQAICNHLCSALQCTRAGQKLKRIVYNEEQETATLEFNDSADVDVIVAVDSGAAMIRDIMRHF